MKYTRSELAHEVANRMAEVVEVEDLVEAYVTMQENYYVDVSLEALIEDAVALNVINPETDEVTDE